MPDSQHIRPLNLRQLLVFLTIGFVSLLFWHTPFLYPVKIFVVFIHEAGHAVTTVLTGGQVISMVVTPWQSGYVQHVGGNPLFIAAAGYVGSALFGGLLLLLSTRDEWASAIFFGLAVFFGLGGVVFALGFPLDAFSVAAVVLSFYAGGSNAVLFSHAADVAAGDERLRFKLSEFRRALDLCHAAVAGNSVNVVKATGMASTLALPELVYASTSIVAEKGNDTVMMNLLLLSYFVLVFITIWLLRRWERQAEHGAA